MIFEQNTKAIVLPLAKIGLISSLFNLQSKSINFNFDYLSPNTKAIVILLSHIGSLSSLFNTFKIYEICKQNQSIENSVTIGHNTMAIVLLFGKIGSFSSLVNLQSKSMNFNFGDVSPKKQGYSLTP